MSKGVSAREKKALYCEKLRSLFKDYKSLLIVSLDNVRSIHLQKTRAKLRNEAVILIGKNTVNRHVIREMTEEIPELADLMPLVKKNVGFVFTNSDIKMVRDKLVEDRVVAPARVGALTVVDIIVPSGPTGIESSKTSFFQTVGIPTKIVKGTIEITTNFTVCKAGSRVDASASQILNMLNISPFTYGINVHHIFSDGCVFDPELLDIKDETLIERFQQGIQRVAALSLASGVPCTASVPHSIINAFKNVVALSITSDVLFPKSEEILERIKNPSAYAVAAPVAAATTEAAPAQAAASVAESEEDDDMGFSLFD